MAVLYGVCAVTLAYLAGGYPYGPVFLCVALALLSAVLAGHRYAAWTAAGLLWAGHLLIGHWLYRWLPPAGDGPAAWGTEGGVTAWVIAVLAASEVVRVRREQWARDRAERAAAERRRVDEERLRIARELHDVLAHSISVINVQAGVGLALLDTDPEQARTALSTIKEASKEALGEVRQVLDTLRAPGEAPAPPAPGLDRLSELVAQAASAGLTVRVEGNPAAGACPRVSTSPRSGSSRRPSPTWCATPAPAPPGSASPARPACWNSASTTTGPPPPRTPAAPAAGSSGCASGPRPSVAPSKPAPARTAVSGSWPCCPSGGAAPQEGA
ncbi:hypothetical protein GCM10020254_10520 [Streptomyces goshikiensis]